MKKLLSFIGFTLIAFSCIAQVEMSKEQFQSLSKAQKDLYLRVKKADSLTTVRINDYLSKNTDPELNYINQDGSVHVLTDIVLGQPVYSKLFNEDAALHTGTNHLQAGGSLGLDLDGTGMTVVVWDGGAIQTTHTEFQNQAGSMSRAVNIETTNIDGGTSQSSHATHVVGTISARGVDSDALGMAPNVNIRTYNFLNALTEQVGVASNNASPTFLTNHSYGFVSEQFIPDNVWIFGAYTATSRTVDDITRINPKYLPVYAAGNDGNLNYSGGLLGGFDKLTGTAIAKNNLVVANASPTINPFNPDVVTFVINSTSSEGPTDDLRIKPDISADGTQLYSTYPSNSYASTSGTSMATPNVTGSLVLLQQYYEQLHGEYMNSSTIKGLVCHTARDDASTIGPDPIFGWGLLDAKRSAEIITEDNASQAVIDELSLANNDTYVLNFSAQAGDKLSATICWTDVPGTSVSGDANLNNLTPRLVNDLDLRITKDGTTFLPWRLEYTPGSGFSNSKGDNIRDNIEKIEIDVPESGNYTLTVSHKGTLQAGAPFQPTDQDFALILTGNSLTLSVNDIDLSNNLSVYPNPNKGEFIISFDSYSSTNEDLKINIYDVHGRLVYKEVFDNTGSIFKELINLNNVQSGVYIANISKGNSSTVRKIIIE